MNKLQTELARQRKKADRIMKDTEDEFTKDRADNKKEIDNRFQHQDQVIQNIQHFITTFQKTLKAVSGKD